MNNNNNNFNFKIGDKVKIKKLSEEEFYEINKPKRRIYKNYLDSIKNYINKIGIITKEIEEKGYTVKFYNENKEYTFFIGFYPEALEKVFDIKTKINFVKELVK